MNVCVSYVKQVHKLIYKVKKRCLCTYFNLRTVCTVTLRYFPSTSWHPWLRAILAKGDTSMWPTFLRTPVLLYTEDQQKWDMDLNGSW